MRADELHECNLPAEVERDNHSIISAGNLEPNPLDVQNLRLWRRPLNVMAGLPVGITVTAANLPIYAEFPVPVADQTGKRPLSTRRSGPVGPHEKLGRKFPRLADGADHLDGQRAAAAEDFRDAGAGAQNLRQLRPGVPELLDRETQYVDRIEGGIYGEWPAPRFVAFHEGDERLESIAVVRAVARAPERLDLSKRGAVLFIRA